MNNAALFTISYGLYVITSSHLGKANGQIANTVFQITSQPATFGISINKTNYTHEFISRGGKFAVSVLAQSTPMTFIGHFGFKTGRDFDKLEKIGHIIGAAGVPIVTDNAVAYLEAEVKQQLDCGTHTIFVGELVGAEVLKNEEPLTYAYYHQVKKGKSPKTAPTYVQG